MPQVVSDLSVDRVVVRGVALLSQEGSEVVGECIKWTQGSDYWVSGKRPTTHATSDARNVYDLFEFPLGTGGFQLGDVKGVRVKGVDSLKLKMYAELI